MTKQHELGHYQDGHVSVAYCKRCSAEGEKLLEDCAGSVLTFEFRDLSKSKIQEKFGVDKKKLLDEKKQTVKQVVIEIRE